MIEIIVKDGDVTVIHGSICNKFKIGVINEIEAWIKDEENKKELREEQPLGTSR